LPTTDTNSLKAATAIWSCHKGGEI